MADCSFFIQYHKFCIDSSTPRMTLDFIRQETADFNFSTDRRIGRSANNAYIKKSFAKRSKTKTRINVQSTSNMDEFGRKLHVTLVHGSQQTVGLNESQKFGSHKKSVRHLHSPKSINMTRGIPTEKQVIAANKNIASAKMSSLLRTSLKQTNSSSTIKPDILNKNHLTSNSLAAGLSKSAIKNPPMVRQTTSTLAKVALHKRNLSLPHTLDTGVGGVSHTWRTLANAQSSADKKPEPLKSRHSRVKSEVVQVDKDKFVKNYGINAFQYISKKLNENDVENNQRSKYALFDQKKSICFRTFTNSISAMPSRRTTSVKAINQRETVFYTYRISVRGQKVISTDG